LSEFRNRLCEQGSAMIIWLMRPTLMPIS
jgi:hypothetical protein